MEQSIPQPESQEKLLLTMSSLPAGHKLVTMEECTKCLGTYNVSERQMARIRNSVIAIVDSVINAYLDTYG